VKAERREKLKSIVGANQDREIPAWVERNGDAMRFQMLGLPNVAQMGLDISANLIVEFYSR
jgi:ribosomal protein S4